ncbi:MAG: Rrf2 family transcriptional regulator, partial [Dehalococcoidia bacterium]|nr:Rrf2 family transcriptional regulator [Dehalococcoidia bacterium]
MKLSTRVRYGMRAMVDLSAHYGERPQLIRDIARRQGISQHYLEQIIIVLKSAGLVKSIRGAKGGIILARAPSQIKLSEVMKVLEGSTAPVECVDDAAVCSRSPSCV